MKKTLFITYWKTQDVDEEDRKALLIITKQLKTAKLLLASLQAELKLKEQKKSKGES